jgi:hypothetical protein
MSYRGSVFISEQGFLAINFFFVSETSSITIVGNPQLITLRLLYTHHTESVNRYTEGVIRYIEGVIRIHRGRDQIQRA